MTGAPALEVSVSRVIAADPEHVWSIISDIPRMGTLSPETLAARWLDGHGEVGARFTGKNRLGLARWSSMATVTAADVGQRFAFETAAPSSSSWRYDLEQVDGGTLMTESMRRQDPQAAPIRIMQRMFGGTDRAAHLRAGMTTTLERLDAAASATTTTQA